jgi:hypothetical protein
MLVSVVNVREPNYAAWLLLSWVRGLVLAPSWAINTAGVESGPNPSRHFSGTE